MQTTLLNPGRKRNKTVKSEKDMVRQSQHLGKQLVKWETDFSIVNKL